MFIHSSSSGYITHVGYLEKPVDADKPDSDWYVIEARGVMYGVVRTRLSQRGWNRWGLMLKYMDYGEYTLPERELGARLLKRGMSGSDVRELQELLMQLGYELPKYGADGDYGDETVSAVTAFQRQAGLTADWRVWRADARGVDGCKPMLRMNRTSMMHSRTTAMRNSSTRC